MSELCSLKRQACCFPGDVCKVDWRTPASAQKACCCNRSSEHIISRGSAKFNTAGPEGKSSGKKAAARAKRCPRAQRGLLLATRGEQWRPLGHSRASTPPRPHQRRPTRAKTVAKATVCLDSLIPDAIFNVSAASSRSCRNFLGLCWNP